MFESEASAWKIEFDMKTKKIYYYNVVTKKSQWEKPEELLSSEEKNAKVKQNSVTTEFFHQMEENIRKKLEKGLTSIDFSSEDMGRHNSLDVSRKYSFLNEIDTSYQPTKVRTISTFDESYFQPFTRSNSIDDISIINIQSIPSQQVYSNDTEFYNNKSSLSENHNDSKRHRRNSTSTVYLDTTISSPNTQAMINCVCAVIRAHLKKGARENLPHQNQYDIFIDNEYTLRGSAEFSKTKEEALALVPSLSTIAQFFSNIYKNSQMENDCIIMSLIYIERLLKATNGQIQIRHYNWKSILLSAMVMASKVWDDLSMWNADFSQVCPSFTLKRINDLELALLNALKFSVRVSASEYAKYYFHLRSRVGLFYPSIRKELQKPLDLQGARRLEELSQELQQDQILADSKRRCVTLHEGADSQYIEKLHTIGPQFSQHVLDTNVSVEQLVHRDFTEADGTLYHSEHIFEIRHSQSFQK